MKNAAALLWASIVRTVVPLIVGAVLAWVAAHNIKLDEQLLTLLATFLTLAFTAIYYVIVRLLETYVTPKLGWLLGLAKTPASYTKESPAK